MIDQVDQRIAKLNPWVKGFSAYVQRLILLDLKHGILNAEGSTNEAVLRRDKGQERPFEVGRSSVLGEPGLSTS
jgi:hypothetical protein